VGIISLIVFFLRVAIIINTLIIIDKSEQAKELLGQAWEEYLEGRSSFSEDLRRQKTLLEMESIFNLLFFLVVGLGCVFIYSGAGSSELGSSREKEIMKPSMFRREIVIDRKRIRNIVLMAIPFGISIFVLLNFINLALNASRTLPVPNPSLTFLVNGFFVTIVILAFVYLLLIFNTVTKKKREITRPLSGNIENTISDKTKNIILVLSCLFFIMVYFWQFMRQVSVDTGPDIMMFMVPTFYALIVSVVVGITAYAIARYSVRPKKREITRQKITKPLSKKTKERITQVSCLVFFLVFVWQYLSSLFGHTGSIDIVIFVVPTLYALVAGFVVGIIAYVIAKYSVKMHAYPAVADTDKS